MRYLGIVISLIVFAGLTILFNTKLGSLPPVGKFFDPFNGFWANSEPKHMVLPDVLKLKGLKDKASVSIDKRRVAHIQANNNHDLYFLQGYMTARDRLFQMDLQTRAALGRLSEVIDNPRVLENDRKNRRKGLPWGAENSLTLLEKDPLSKEIITAYTEGINAYISGLSYKRYPIEYKLLDFEPEPWTPLKTAGLLKYMADMLTGGSEDWEYTNAWAVWGPEKIASYFPEFDDSLSPIIPSGTKWNYQGKDPDAPAGYRPLSLQNSLDNPKTKSPEGSNNWAVSGSKTKSGFPILCNDPHLALNLPSIWYEIQLSAPGINCYGASLPGAPGVIIGFNDSIAWGVTNASRDVLDWYKVEFKDASRQEYRFGGEWKKTEFRVEHIKVRGKADLLDTVAYTLHGPVMYDANFHPGGKPLDLALRWTAHDSTNEMMTFYGLNRAQNHAQYREALKFFDCPGQNFVFASASGDIAITQQGHFPHKWKDQGRYILDGSEPSHLWQSYIPDEENPHVLNPERGFVSSANQHPVDSLYPYHTYGKYEYYRNRRINQVLASLSGLTVEDMKKLQGDNLNLYATEILPILLPHVQQDLLNAAEKKALDALAGWNRFNDPQLTEPSLFTEWSNRLDAFFWMDEVGNPAAPLPDPEHHIVAMLLKQNPDADFVDDIRTPVRESLNTVATATFRDALSALTAWSDSTKKEYRWAEYKNTGAIHLLRLEPFTRRGLMIGGDLNIVNACNRTHGPSWRMIVEFSPRPKGLGIFPGGQSGNPGSPWYDNMIPKWAKGEYEELVFLQAGETKNASILNTIHTEPKP